MRYFSLFHLSRPANSLAVGGLVLASCMVASTDWKQAATMLAVLGSMLVAAGGYAINDVYDYETDRIAHEKRVLPQGKLDHTTAKVFAICLLIGAPLLFVFINQLSLLSAILSALLLFLYSWKLKSANGILGNLATAVLASNAALLGGLVMSDMTRVAPLAVCVFCATLSREITKDIEDLSADRWLRSRTLPMALGNSGAARLAAFLAGLAVLASYLPYHGSVFGLSYLLLASVINTVVLVAAVRLAIVVDSGIKLTQRLIKIGMFLYILLFLLAAFIGF